MFKFNTYIITENKFMLNFNSFKVKVLCAAFFGQKENYRVTKHAQNCWDSPSKNFRQKYLQLHFTKKWIF